MLFRRDSSCCGLQPEQAGAPALRFLLEPPGNSAAAWGRTGGGGSKWDPQTPQKDTEKAAVSFCLDTEFLKCKTGAPENNILLLLSIMSYLRW